MKQKSALKTLLPSMAHTTITPSESMSFQVLATISIEMGRQLTPSEVEEVIHTKTTDAERALWATMPELPCSDDHPGEDRMEWSCKYVASWMERNDCTVAGLRERAVDAEGNESDRFSFVSVFGGGVLERPRCDVPAWEGPVVEEVRKEVRFEDNDEKGRSEGVQRRRRRVRRVKEPIYNKPTEKLPLVSRLIRRISEAQPTRKQQELYKENLITSLFSKKAEKLSMKKNIPVEVAAKQLHTKKDREENKNMMSGGRSRGASSRASVSKTNSSHGQTSFSTAGESIDLTRSEFERCVEDADDGLKGKSVEDMESVSELGSETVSETESSGTDSSRDSAINWGSVLGQSDSIKEDYKNQRFAAKNEGKLRMPATQELSIRVTPGSRAPLISQQKPVSYVPTKPQGDTIPSRREERRRERREPYAESAGFQEHMASRGLIVPPVPLSLRPSPTSPTAEVLRQRRAERAARPLHTEKYKARDRERLWKDS